jgi:hypothetical protein
MTNKVTKAEPSPERVAQIAEEARQWIASLEGQAAVAEGLQRAQAMADEFREAQRVDPETRRKSVIL